MKTEIESDEEFDEYDEEEEFEQFDDIPASIDKHLRIFNEEFISIDGYEALKQEHRTKWIKYWNIYFLTKDVENIDDDKLKLLIRKYVTEDNEVTVRRGSKYTTVCYDITGYWLYVD